MPLISKIPSETPIGFSISSMQRPFHLFAYAERVKVDFMYAFAAISVIPIRPIFVQWDQIYTRNLSPEELSKLVPKAEPAGKANGHSAKVESRECSKAAEQKVKLYRRKAKKKSKEGHAESVELKSVVKPNEVDKMIVIAPEEKKQKLGKTIRIPTLIRRGPSAPRIVARNTNKDEELLRDVPISKQTIVVPMVSRATSSLRQREVKDNLPDDAESFERLVLGSSKTPAHSGGKLPRPKRRCRKDLTAKMEGERERVGAEKEGGESRFEEVW